LEAVMRVKAVSILGAFVVAFLAALIMQSMPE